MVQIVDLVLVALEINKKALRKSSMTEQSAINEKYDFYLSHIFNNLAVIENVCT